MTVVLTVNHNFVCPVVDDADSNTVSPSHWNDNHGVGGVDQINTELAGKVDTTRALTAGAGLTGGGDLSANRTFDVAVGEGIVITTDAVALDTSHARNVDHTGITLTAGAGLSGGGTLAANRTFDVGGSTSIIVGADDVQRAALTGDVTAAQNVNGTTIANNVVSYAKMQDVTATARVLGRKTAAAGDPEECTLSEVLDFIGSATQGDILYRGASAWAKLGAGGAGTLLQSGGVGSNPSWASPAYQASDADLTSWAGVVRAAGFDAFVATPNSANLRTLLTDEVGTGAAYFVGGALGTPASGTLSSCTGYPLSQLTGLGTNVGTFLATASSANLRAAMTDESGDGALLFANGALGTPASGNLGNCTNLGGTGTNDNAAAGDVGEYLESEITGGAAQSISNGVNKDLTSLSLTAGDWNVWGAIAAATAGGGALSAVFGWVSTTSATLPSDTNKGAYIAAQPLTYGASNGPNLPVGQRRYSVSSTTTVYLSMRAHFGSGTCVGHGVICARRVR